jgi:outer membrane protein assembly factor BamB
VAANSGCTEIWYGLNSSGSGTSITITYTASDNLAARVAEFSGIATAGALDVSAGCASTAVSPATIPSLTTTNANDLILGVYGTSVGNTYGVSTSSFSDLATVTATNDVLGASYLIVSSTGTYTSSRTLTPSFDKGFNFRKSQAYVTDGANETYVLGDLYPTTRNGVTFGWGTNIANVNRDRVATNDRRLAGVNQQTNNGTQVTFRVDLPAPGTYQIHLALGDAGFGQANQYLQILDNTTVLMTIDKRGVGTAAQQFYDATGALLTNTTWPTSEKPTTLTFASTTLNVVIGSPTSVTNSSTLAHLRIADGTSASEGAVALKAATCAAVAPATSLAAQAQSTQATIYWASTSPNVMVLEKPTTAFAGEVPTNGTTYTANVSTIGAATVRYVGPASNFTRTGLTNNTTYYYQVFAYTGSGAATCYSPAAAAAVTARPSSTTQEAWSYMLAGGSALKPPIAGNDGIFLSSNAGQMISLNSTTGLQNWTPYATTSAVQGWLIPTPLSAGGNRVFAGDQGGKVYALDSSNGAVRWQPALTGATAIQPGPSVHLRAYANSGFTTAYPATSTVNFVTEAHAAAGAVASLTYALTVPAGTDRALIVSVQLGSGCAGAAVPTVTGVTYAGVAMTQITSILGTPCGPGTTRSEQWRLVAPATGTNSVVVTLSGAAPATIHSGAMLFTGVHQTTPVRAFASASGGPASGNGGSSTVTVTSAVGDMIVNTVGQGTSITAAGQTQRFLNNVNSSNTLNNSGGSTAPGAASVVMTWTFGASDEWQTISASLQPSASAYDLLYVATKNGAGSTNNKVFALRSDTGAVVWTFNDGSAGNTWSVGEINGMPAVDYGRNRLYVTSMSTSGTGASLWIVDITTGLLVGSPGACPTANTACVNLGDIDTSPNISFDGNTLWVGNKTGSVYAISLAAAPGPSMLKWTAPLALGASNQLKGLVWEDFSTSGRLYMVVANTTAASNAVRCFLDPGIGGTPNAASACSGWGGATVTINGAQAALPNDKLYVTSWDGVTGRIQQLDFATGTPGTAFTLGDGTRQPGDISTDLGTELFVGTTEGKIFKISLPIPP